MKKLIKYFWVGAFAIGLSAQAADTGLNPTALKVKVYKFAVSTDPLCTNMITVYQDDAPSYQNVFDSPTIGSGVLPDGEYPCVAMEMSDQLNVISGDTSDTGNCVAGRETTQQVCQSGSTYQKIDGTTGTCTDSEDIMTIWISTYATSSGGDNNNNPFEPPASEGDATQGINLSGSLIVSGAQTGTFLVNGTGKLVDQNSICDMQPPVFGFR